MKKRLVNYYLFATFLATGVLVITAFLLYIKMQEDFLFHHAKEIYTKELETYKNELKNRVEMVEQQVLSKKIRTEERLKNTIRNRVDEVCDVAESLYLQYHNSMEETALKRLIIETLRTIRFNEGRGYYFINTFNGENVLSPLRPSIEGKNILHYQDIHQKFVVKELIDIAKNEKEGYLSYWTYKPNQGEKRFEKIAFVKAWERFGWVIGTGEYIDDVENDIKKELALELTQYRTDNKRGYINIFEVHTFEGGENFATLIVSPNSEGNIYGQKISDAITDIHGFAWRKDALAQVRLSGDGFVQYHYKKIDSSEIGPKIAYFKKLTHWNWVISTGKELDDFEARVEGIRKNVRSQVWDNVRYALWVLGGMLLVLVGIGGVISYQIKQDVSVMKHLLKMATTKKEELNQSHFSIEEFKEIVGYVNQMVKELKSQHRKLSLLNENLEFSVYEKTKELQGLNISLESKNQELEHNYLTDMLTQLPNRNSLNKNLMHIPFPQVILLDIDGFKHINDFYGNVTGDRILIEFSRYIEAYAKPYNMALFRLSSDEFLLLNDHIADLEAIKAFAQGLFEHISTRVFTSESLESTFQIGFTCGIASGKGNILEKADLALNFAKKKKLFYAFYDENNETMNVHKHNLLWRQRILEALRDDGIVPYFQKIIDFRTKKVLKYECLMRLRYEKGEMGSPYFFLDVAKETKLYPELSRAMIERCIRRFADETIDFTLNISLLDIESKTTVSLLMELIDGFNMGKRVILELLETEEILKSEAFPSFVETMKQRGVRFALDDFGSGYSNFSFVFKLSPAYIKIDGSLVKAMLEDQASYRVIESIIAFAKAIHAEVIAECVETKELADALNAMGIIRMQGYYFSLPSPNL